MRTKIIEQASGHLFTIEECRAQCEVVPYDQDSDGVFSHPDDELLLNYLDAAVEYAESFTGLSIAVRTYEVALDCFPRLAAIDLPNPPLIDLLTFTTGDGSDAADVDSSVWVLDDYSQPARLVSSSASSSWPVQAWAPNAIKIRYTAGYAPNSDGSTVPKNIRQAIMLTLADWYNNREDSADRQSWTLPNGAEALLRPMRVRLGMA